jgi:xanthine/uracil permease
MRDIDEVLDPTGFKRKHFGPMRELYRFGLGFWTGAFIYSLVNLLMNLKHANNILLYDGIITGVAIIGFTLNLVLLKRKKK